MSVESYFFAKKRVVFERLVPFGFEKSLAGYDYREKILNGDFEVRLHISADGQVSGKVMDTDLGEEYLALHVAGASGNFVGKVREAYQEVLERVAEACFEALPFASDQMNRLANHLKTTYGDDFDHPFEKYPEFSSFRYPENQKWYGLVMTLARGKLDLGGEQWSQEELDEKVEIINIKVDKEALSELKGIYPSYHMNKKSWVTLVFDDALSDEQLFSLVENSRALVAGKALGSSSGPDYWIIPANPKYYDIDAEFAANKVILWTQKASIKKGDFVAIYITAPMKAVRYFCQVLEVDLPNDAYRDDPSIKKLMKIQLLHTFSDEQVTFETLKSCGVKAVRGPRRMTKELIEKIDSLRN
ncbi:MmcQ/YjbR family DNA-binding protein [Streptococcus ruminicola]|uniref:MmcQ/YjbR family DNA-binding protein n=1 Tax=Streptococcus ruminicola TaxID=2686210 RepID=UPI003F63FD0D